MAKIMSDMYVPLTVKETVATIARDATDDRAAIAYRELGHDLAQPPRSISGNLGETAAITSGRAARTSERHPNLGP